MQNIPASPRGHATEDKKVAASCVGTRPAETGETRPSNPLTLPAPKTASSGRRAARQEVIGSE